jgi:hypothetical protein
MLIDLKVNIFKIKRMLILTFKRLNISRHVSQCPCNVLANYGMYNLEGGLSPLAFASDDEGIR